MDSQKIKEFNKDSDLFLLNTTPLFKGIGVTKICDEYVYVDNKGNVLMDIQWFYFQLVEIVTCIIENDGKNKKIDKKKKLILILRLIN